MAHRGGGSGGRGKPKNRPTPYDRVGKQQQQQQQEGGFVINTEGHTEGLRVEPLDQGDVSNIPSHPPQTQLKKFTNKARLFFGNLPRDFTEDELKQILSAHGEVQEIYHSKDKNFAFARMVRDHQFYV